MTDAPETACQLAARTCKCGKLYTSKSGVTAHIKRGACSAPAVAAPLTDFAAALAAIAEQSEKRFQEFKERSERDKAEFLLKIAPPPKKVWAAVAAAPPPPPTPVLPPLPVSPPESVAPPHIINHTLEFIFTKVRPENTTDYWWLLKDNYKNMPERFTLENMTHTTPGDDMPHITFSYKIPTYKNSWVKNYFHLYHTLGVGGSFIYRSLRGMGLNKTPIIIAVFSDGGRK
jgi:hypothetical protein